MRAAPLVLLLAVAACVPADDAVPLGATEFVLGATPLTQTGIDAAVTADGYAVRFDRIVLSFKTMTIGKVGTTDQCSYRGKAARSDVVFDPRRGFTQQFNGIKPVVCPDVGVIFAPPDGRSSLGDGVPSADLVELATGEPAHALVDATTTSPAGERWTIRLRFATARTASQFGGCHVGEARGVTILPGVRDTSAVSFAAEALFREVLADEGAALRGASFARADADGDHEVTMTELDRLPLVALGTEAFQLADGSQDGTFGDYLRQQFRFTVFFRAPTGLCTGNAPDGAAH